MEDPIRQALADLAAFLRAKIPVATSEDLILMKIVAGRPRDQDDVRGIVARSGKGLDWTYPIETGRQLGEAIGQDVTSVLRSLREESGGR